VFFNVTTNNYDNTIPKYYTASRKKSNKQKMKKWKNTQTVTVILIFVYQKNLLENEMLTAGRGRVWQ